MHPPYVLEIFDSKCVSKMQVFKSARFQEFLIKVQQKVAALGFS